MHFPTRLLSKRLSTIQPDRHQTTYGQAATDPIDGSALSLLALVAIAIVAPSAHAVSESPVPVEEVHDSLYSVKLPTAKQVSPKVSFVVSLSPTDAKPGATVTLTVEAVIQSGWHISAVGGEQGDSPSLPTSIEFEARGLTPIDKGFSPSVEPSLVKIGNRTHLQHTGSLSWQRKYRVTAQSTDYSGTGSIRFQVCDEDACLPPNNLAFTLGAEAKVQPVPAKLPGVARKTVGDPITIVLAEANLERNLINTTELVTADPEEDWDDYVKQLMASMNAKEALTLVGSFQQDGSSVALYLAEQEEYSLVNTGNGETNFENTSTYISIDHNGDGQIVDYESVASNLPIRLFDSMFLVTEISKSKKTITLQQIDIPLSGAVLNRRCPDFQYETIDGQIISNESIRGTTTILDIWAVT